MDKKPLTDEVFQEAMQRLGEYTHPKRQAELNYVMRYARLLDNYQKYVRLCIEGGTTPMTWEQWTA
jgi:hypothetical protein